MSDDKTKIVKKKNKTKKDKSEKENRPKKDKKDKKNNKGSEIAKNGYLEELLIIKDLNTNEKLCNIFIKFIGKDSNSTKDFKKICGTTKSDINNSDNITMQIKKFSNAFRSRFAAPKEKLPDHFSLAAKVS